MRLPYAASSPPGGPSRRSARHRGSCAQEQFPPSPGRQRVASIWVVNSLGLIAVTPGHDPPDGPFYEPVVERMFADVESAS